MSGWWLGDCARLGVRRFDIELTRVVWGRSPDTFGAEKMDFDAIGAPAGLEVLVNWRVIGFQNGFLAISDIRLIRPFSIHLSFC